jgi:hypothetical protein
MRNKEKIDAIKMTRAIRDQLYKRYQAGPEEYYRHLNEGFKKFQEEFSKRAKA